MRSLFLAGLCFALSGFFRPGDLTPSQDRPLREYEARWTGDSIHIDGVLSDAGWADAPWSEPFVDIRGHEFPPPPLTTRVKLLWDDTHLYVGVELEEPHLWGTLTDRDAIIYRDDDFEVFLDPNGDGEEYYEIEVNALGTILDLFLARPYGRGGRAEIGWDAQNLLSSVHTEGTLNDPSDRDKGWSVELAIRWSDLRPPESYETAPPLFLDDSQGTHTPGSPPSPGSEWRANFSRVDWPLEVVAGEGGGHSVYQKADPPPGRTRHPEENWVWAPQGAINMHLPERWGLVRFLGPTGGRKDQ